MKPDSFSYHLLRAAGMLLILVELVVLGVGLGF